MKYFANELRRLAQGVGYRVRGAKTIFLLAHEKYQHMRERTSPTAKCFAITDPKRTNLTGKDLWNGATSLFSQDISV